MTQGLVFAVHFCKAARSPDHPMTRFPAPFFTSIWTLSSSPSRNCLTGSVRQPAVAGLDLRSTTKLPIIKASKLVLRNVRTASLGEQTIGSYIPQYKFRRLDDRELCC